MRKNLLISIFILLILPLEEGYSQTMPVVQTYYFKDGIANLKEENYEEAVEDLKKAREYDPGSSITAYFLGVAYKKVQDYREAKINLKDAITLQPAVREAVAELADTLYQLGEMEGALKELEIAEMLGIKSARTSFLKGQVLSGLGKKSDIFIEEDAITYKGKGYPYTKNEDGTITVEEGPLKGKVFYISYIEAIESFKRAKSLEKKLTTSADYQIAMVNLQEGNLDEARDILKEVVVRDPNADIAQFANQYIEAITRRIREESPFRFSASTSYQHDSNVILKPSDVTAAGDIAGEDDSVGIASVRGEFIPRLRPSYSLKTQYSLFQNTHSRLKTYDVQSHFLALVPGYNFARGSINLLTGYNYTSVNNIKYIQTVTLSPALTIFLSRTQFALISTKYQDKKYLRDPLSPDEDRDGSEKGAGLSWFYLIDDGRGFINLRYEFNREDTEGKNWKYSGNKAGLNLLYPLAIITQHLTLNAGGEAFLQVFDDVHMAFKKKRDDKTYTFNTMLTYKLYKDMDIQMQYIYNRADSNISVYGYNKDIVTMGVEARF